MGGPTQEGDVDSPRSPRSPGPSTPQSPRTPDGSGPDDAADEDATADCDDTVVLARVWRDAGVVAAAAAVSPCGSRLASALSESASLLAASAASMTGAFAAAEKGGAAATAWWASRVALDARAASLLSSLATVLSPGALAALAPGPPLATAMAALSLSGRNETPQRPAVLVLDHPLQALPWEAAAAPLGALGPGAVTRCPSVAIARRLAGAEAGRQEAGGRGTGGQGAGGGGLRDVDASRGVCVVNAGGDLAATQQAFEGWLGAVPGWDVHFGAPGPDGR